MKQSTHWNKKWANRKHESPNNFAKRAYKLIKNKKLKTLLDVGCGQGRDAIYFAQKGLKVTAMDISKTATDKIIAKNKDIKCVVRQLEKIKLPKNSFDVIYAHLSLHYFDDKITDKIFTKLYNVLKKEGLIFIKCKSVEDILYGKGVKVGKDMYLEKHIRHFFSKEYMVRKLSKFKIIKIRKTSFVYHSYKSSFIEAIATK